MKTITLNIDDAAMDNLVAIISVRLIGGASGPIEDMLLSILTLIDEGKDQFLIAGCEGKLIVEAVD